MKTTSFNQLKQLLLWDFTTHRKQYLLTFAGSYIANILLMLFAMNTAKDKYMVIFNVFAFVFFVSYSISNSMFVLKTKQDRLFFLMLPVNNNIKFITRYFLSVCFWPIIFILTFFLADFTQSLFQNYLEMTTSGSFFATLGHLYKNLFPNFSPQNEFFKELLFLYISLYLFIPSLFLLAANYFRKNALQKIILAVYLFILPFSFILHHYTPHITKNRILFLTLLLTIGIIVSHILSYKFFVKSQVIEDRGYKSWIPKFKFLN